MGNGTRNFERWNNRGKDVWRLSKARMALEERGNNESRFVTCKYVADSSEHS